jgi:hypothetical protein
MLWNNCDLEMGSLTKLIKASPVRLEDPEENSLADGLAWPRPDRRSLALQPWPKPMPRLKLRLKLGLKLRLRLKLWLELRMPTFIEPLRTVDVGLNKMFCDSTVYIVMCFHSLKRSYIFGQN